MSVAAKLKNFHSTIAAKKPAASKGNSRSRLLKMVMPSLSGDLGKLLAGALNNPREFKEVWEDVTVDVLGRVKAEAKKNSPPKVKKKVMASEDCKCPKEKSGADCPLIGCKRKALEEAAD